MQVKEEKAFTLTELLVVVVIIGVLSAVVLPKFNKILESRKTTEAEEMMTAVRNEQEARCSISKNYTANLGQLASLNNQTETKNYTYQINDEGVGMIATAKSGKYRLEIPSYVDGRICCSDVEKGGCAGLNKDYPLCSDLTNTEKTPNFVQGNKDCEAEIPPACNEGDTSGSQVCNGCGTQTTQICKDGQWVDQLGECSKKEEECKEYCESGKPGWDKWEDVALHCEHSQGGAGTWNTQTCKCDCKEGVYNESTGECEKSCDTLEQQMCLEPQDPDAIAGMWNNQTCKCDCAEGYVPNPDPRGGGCLVDCPRTPQNESLAQSCTDPQVVPGYAPVEGTWNWAGPNACKCICPQGYKLDERGQCVLGCDRTRDNEEKAHDCEEPNNYFAIGMDGGGNSYYNIVPGSWNWASCECECPDAPESFLPGVTWEYVSYKDQCYLHCTSDRSTPQIIKTCVYGTDSDREQGIAERGHWNQWSCSCQCATRKGVQERKNGAGVYACYRDNCQTGHSLISGNWDFEQERCELLPESQYTECAGNTYYNNKTYGKCNKNGYGPLAKGKWNAEKCQCNCPAGTILEGSQCKAQGAVADDDRDDGQDTDYGIADDMPDSDPEYELDDDYMTEGSTWTLDYTWNDFSWAGGDSFEFEIIHHVGGHDDGGGGYGDDRDDRDWDGW